MLTYLRGGHIWIEICCLLMREKSFFSNTVADKNEEELIEGVVRLFRCLQDTRMQRK
jgi:hypothetical protein